METVTLNLKEQKRLLVLNRINQGKLNGEQAAELLGLSERHVRRLLARFREDGASALAHGNRGRLESIAPSRAAPVVQISSQLPYSIPENVLLSSRPSTRDSGEERKQVQTLFQPTILTREL